MKKDVGTVYGYMRISTDRVEQKFDRQEAQLLSYGVDPDLIYSERMSGSKRSRPELDKVLGLLEDGDTLVILSIDRLSRSTKDLLDIVDVIKSKGASLKSLQDSWLDTSSDNPMSDFLLTVMGALAEMERKQTIKRVKEGMQVAKSKGTHVGRPRGNRSKVTHAMELYDAGKHTVKEIEEITGLSRATIYRRLRERDLQESQEKIELGV